MNEGKNLRKEKLILRDALSKKEIAQKSFLIEEKIMGLDAIKKSENIFIYVSFRSEVNTISLIEKLMKKGKRVSVPITHVQKKRMDAVFIENMKKDLVPGYCNILEPHKDRVDRFITDPGIIEAVIVPGSVFDERGGRFGYGGGYYDRFLEKIPAAVRIGLAFELQVVEKAPIQDHDEILDFIITEKKIRQTSRI